MVKAEQKSQLTDLALVDLVAAVPQAAKAVLVDDEKADNNEIVSNEREESSFQLD